MDKPPQRDEWLSIQVLMGLALSVMKLGSLREARAFIALEREKRHEFRNRL